MFMTISDGRFAQHMIDYERAKLWTVLRILSLEQIWCDVEFSCVCCISSCRLCEIVLHLSLSQVVMLNWCLTWITHYS